MDFGRYLSYFCNLIGRHSPTLRGDSDWLPSDYNIFLNGVLPYLYHERRYIRRSVHNSIQQRTKKEDKNHLKDLDLLRNKQECEYNVNYCNLLLRRRAAQRSLKMPMSVVVDGATNVLLDK